MKALSQRKYEKFKKRKTALWSFWILLTLILVSALAEMIANSNPFYIRFNERNFFPILKHYSAQEFFQDDIQPNYREFCSKFERAWCLWPLVRFGPLEIDHQLSNYPSPPSKIHILGVDSVGRDIFSRMIYGFRVSFGYALGVWFFSFIIGTLIGACMGYFGGWVDLFFYRLMEVFFSIPYLIVLITLVSIFTPSIYWLIIISSLFHWGHITRYMRAEFLKVRHLDFVKSAQSVGCTTKQILFRHILPNSMTPIITFSPFFIASSILGLSSLDFLGLGVPPPTPSWGELLRQGKEFFMSAWYLAFFPSMGLFSVLALINFIGEGVRDAFDPRT